MIASPAKHFYNLFFKLIEQKILKCFYNFRIFLVLGLLLSWSCKETSKVTDSNETPSAQESSSDLSAIATKEFREFEVLDSRFVSRLDIWTSLNASMSDFTEDDYNRLKSLVLDQDIPTLQSHVKSGKLSYEQLTKFYLYRIRATDRENDLSLNSVISLNPNIITEAKAKDEAIKNNKNAHLIYGMPILLKDNINTIGMPTTAGSVALKDNRTSDAFVIKQIKNQGGLILGKANLSEWAYFFCGNCPSGYSALGGQTLNPYGRKIFDTGGSSSGSAVAVAANFCAAAVGSETAGSILSPASQNSVVGIKPTIGLISRSGIIPISETLDTAGPIGRSVIDIAILLDAMYGFDRADKKSMNVQFQSKHFYTNIKKDNSLEGKKFGAFKPLLEDPLYKDAISALESKGAIIVQVDEIDVSLPHFIRLLNLDMKKNFPSYMANHANPSVKISNIDDVIAFNIQDSVNVMPYGQALFRGISEDKGNAQFLRRIKDILKTNGRRFFDEPIKEFKLDGLLSINNYHAGFAAVAEYPALTVPMGYAENGAPKGLTFIAQPKQEKQLLTWAYSYEQASKKRESPKNYK
ncbi:amidase family protein [Paucihalobacter sp.]|uniref:amidase family protein n=1 Tax=Paucihalobacter sp. TaxID=2850405 RepID=UPI003D161B44